MQTEQSYDYKNYVETQLLQVQARKSQRFFAFLKLGSDTMLNFMNHRSTIQNENYL